MSQEPQVWALRLTARACADIAAARAFVLETAGRKIADEWEQGLEDAIMSLATLPERNAIAPESAMFPPPPLRDIVYRRRPRGPGHRILYRLYNDPNEAPTVRIVAVWHGARAPLTPEESRRIESGEE